MGRVLTLETLGSCGVADAFAFRSCSTACTISAISAEISGCTLLLNRCVLELLPLGGGGGGGGGGGAEFILMVIEDDVEMKEEREK